MTTSNWEAVNRFILACGASESLDGCAELVLHQMQELVPYSCGIAMIFEGGKKPARYKYMNFKRQWLVPYLDYYADMKIRRSEMLDPDDVIGESFFGFTDWTRFPRGEFLNDYIKRRGLFYSGYISIKDSYGQSRVTFAFDRTQDRPFNQAEREMIQTVLPHLNLICNRIRRDTQTGGQSARRQVILDMAELTPQEQKIVKMLCHGVTQADISKALCISPATTRKHIAHAYK